MQLSDWGKKLTADSAIVELMDDLGTALRETPDCLFMGGGNPAFIPQAEAVFQQHLSDLARDAQACRELLAIYQSPKGDLSTRTKLAEYLNEQFSLTISAENIAFANGSQSAFALLFNLYAGPHQGCEKKILLPLVPEYLGYADVGIHPDTFIGIEPIIESQDAHRFKYRLNRPALDALLASEQSQNIGAICLSRPTNPTGNVITDAELSYLSDVAKQLDVPLIIDDAYGQPFPNILFAQAKLHFDSQTVLMLSLSKLGLPGVRTGIVVANKSLIEAFAKVNTIANLAPGNLGPALLDRLLDSGDLERLSHKPIPEFYQQRSILAQALLDQHLSGLPYRIHQSEGAIFLWLWLPDLPISAQALYQRLKAKGLLVIPGESFFLGLDEAATSSEISQHRCECIRLSYAQSPEILEQGIALLAQELTLLYDGSSQ